MAQTFYLPSINLWQYQGIPSVLNAQFFFTASQHMVEDESWLRHARGKIEEALPMFIMYPITWYMGVPYEQLHPEIQAQWQDLSIVQKGYVFGFGTDGFRDRVQTDGRIASFYPALPSKSKFNEAF
jgi:hypothetical protein